MNLVTKHADEIRDMWQSRALRAARGKLRKVVITALAKEYVADFETLLKATFPGFVDLDRPLFTSYAHIDLGGRIICEMIDKEGRKRKVMVYGCEDAMIYEMRKLADKLKLPDRDRIEMFTVLQKWVAKDMRIGIQGQRLAS